MKEELETKQKKSDVEQKDKSTIVLKKKLCNTMNGKLQTMYFHFSQ